MSDRVFGAGICAIIMMMGVMAWALGRIGGELRGMREIGERMDRL